MRMARPVAESRTVAEIPSVILFADELPNTISGKSGAPNCAVRCTPDKTRAKWSVSQVRHAARASVGVMHVRIRRP